MILIEKSHGSFNRRRRRNGSWMEFGRFETNLKKFPLFLKYMYFMHYKIQNILATVVEITD